MIQSLKKEFAKGGNVFSMIYLAHDGMITKRTIKVFKIDGEKVFAYCYLRKGIRTFQLSQILSWEKASNVDYIAI